jgi:SAM-dependent methyltransferase
MSSKLSKVASMNNTDKAALLLEINKDIPLGVDWSAGARRYVSAFFNKSGRAATERYSLIKPFAQITDETRPEIVAYFNNFVNLVHRLKLTANMKVLDVACGGGWVSHYLSKLGCDTFGFDISDEFVELARRRIREDPTLTISDNQIDGMFEVHDIEKQSLADQHRGTFDIAVLESCLHHFVDPIAAMSHIAKAIKDDGIVVIIEGENRKGAIKDEWMSVMREFETLERPYPRKQLQAVLDMAGLPEREFMGQLNGWFSLDEEVARNASWFIEHSADSMNLCICAKRSEPLANIFPSLSRGGFLRFGSGWYPPESGLRWCGPVGEIKAIKASSGINVTLHGNGKTQTVVIYGPEGERTRAEFSEGRTRVTIALGDLAAGDTLTFVSNVAFRPSWDGSNDQRLLSFYAEATE